MPPLMDIPTIARLVTADAVARIYSFSSQGTRSRSDPVRIRRFGFVLPQCADVVSTLEELFTLGMNKFFSIMDGINYMSGL